MAKIKGFCDKKEEEEENMEQHCEQTSKLTS